MAVSYTHAQQSFDKLHEQILSATGHRLKLSNYVISRLDHIARHAIECGTEIGARGKARVVATKAKGHLEKFFSPSCCESDSLTAMGHGRMERASHGADGL